MSPTKWGIRTRVMLVAVLPSVILALVMTALFTRYRLADLEQAHTERARAQTRQLAVAAEFAMFTGNRAALQRLAESALSETDVVGVRIVDRDGHVLAAANREWLTPTANETPLAVLGSTGSASLQISEPVMPTQVALDDDPTLEVVLHSGNPSEAFGRVTLEVSRRALAAQRAELLGVSLAILLSVLFGSYLLARRMSNSVSNPIREAATVVVRIGEGKLDERVSIISGGSLKRLAEGINDMAMRLERSHELMQRQVAEATAELRRSKEEAERANLAKSRFLTAASHDLRQPMHALGLFISELAQRDHGPEALRLVRQIAASAEALEELLESLLDISRLDADVVQPEIRGFPLQPLLDRLTMGFAGTAAERDVLLRIRPCEGWALTDPLLFERILANLISNAIRYTPRGTVLVCCRRRGERIRIEVRDSGIGIPREAQEIIFQEFVQIENPERAHHKGLGLGLAIVRKLTTLLALPLDLQSCAGKGSTFSVSVPLAPTTPLLPSAEGAREPGNLSGIRVALVDHDPLVRDSLGRLLRSWDCAVSAADSAEALGAAYDAAGLAPQLLISDFRLRGGVDGVGLIRAMRTRYDPGLPAILISGDMSPEVLQTAQLEGLVLLHKPVRPAKLRALLNRLLAGT